jgi:NADH pyrophosphatase NudC (nudix superfamily)
MLNLKTKFVLIERGKEPKGLDMFSGYVKQKESPEEAFMREVKEELNVDVKKFKIDMIHVYIWQRSKAS